MMSACKFWEEALAGGKESADKGQANLSAVSVTCKAKVYAEIFVNLKNLGSVGEENAKSFLVCAGDFTEIISHDLLSAEPVGRPVVEGVFYSQNQNFFILSCDFDSLVIHIGYTCFCEFFDKIFGFFLEPCFVVTCYIVAGCNFLELLCKGEGDLGFCFSAVYHIACDCDNIGFCLFCKFNKLAVIL